MRLTKVSGGWLVEPETSTEQEHLRYLLEGLADRQLGSSSAGSMRQVDSAPAIDSRPSGPGQSTACEAK